ncbi:MAG: type 1 glutamine amidotransferase [Arenicellales bacterium]
MAGRPLIGVTGPDKLFRFGWWFTRYALMRAGADSVYMTARSRGPLEHMDAMVIGGGDDISPGLYGDLVNPDIQYDPDRDEFESEVIDYALNAHLPILGICRGAQLLNVKLGGNLYDDIRNMRWHTSNRNTLFPRKQVWVASGSGLNATLGAATILVNSLHFQAIKDVGEGLEIVARDRDNIVQAVEDPERRLLGVQWHPEYIPQSRVHRKIFRDLVQKAGTGRDCTS